MFRLPVSIGAALVALVTVLNPTGGRASDMAFGGFGASLVPIVEPRVRMVSEEINLTRVAPEGYRVMGPGFWRIEARYRLFNLTDAAFTVRIGLPEPAGPPEGDCAFDGYAGLTTTVRGEPVALTPGSVAPDHPMAEGIARVHLFTVRFSPGETVAVTHSYRHGLSEYTDGGEEVTFLTRTAAYWAGTIGEARIRVTLPFRPWGLSLANWSNALELFEERLVDGVPRIEFVLSRTDWMPETDLRIYIGPGGPSASTSALIEGCLAPGQLFTNEMEVGAFDVATAAARLGPLDDKMLRGCRNSVYAHHGYPFADAALNREFYGETGIRVLPSQAGTGRPGVVFARNPDFSPSMLTAAEHAYVAAIKALERQR